MRGDETDGSDFDEWVVRTEEEVKNALIDSEIFVEVRETSTNHVAGGDLATGPAGPDVILQVTEATTDTLTSLDETLETCRTLTQVGGDAEEQAEPMFYPDDVPELILSVEASDLRFARPDDRLDEDRETLRRKVGVHREKILDSDLESGPIPGLNPAPTNLGELERPTREEVDTPTLLKVLFPSLDPSQEPAVRCGCNNYR
jgi:hypothetical protein